ncbi:MAG: methylated-DNA--[Bacteroidales bacterium]|nr:methylated-DNA--[protein]-cysteine S-methyltransferase [Bacteroidales bacterium]
MKKEKIRNLGRSHGEVITLEQMTHADWGRHKKKKVITHSVIGTPYGKMLVASFGTGICFMGMYDSNDVCMSRLREIYPNVEFKRQTTPEHRNVQNFLRCDWSKVEPIRLYVKGTDFQIKVWQELLNIPVGKVSSYGEIARNIGNPRSVRAVGNAVGRNPVVYLIPCHRVICNSGKPGNFLWGPEVKLLFLNHESAPGRKMVGYFNWEPTLF